MRARSRRRERRRPGVLLGFDRVRRRHAAAL